MPIVFITGATSGFGEATAKAFAEAKFDLILNGRREDRLDKLCAELQAQHGIKCLAAPFDVRSRTSAEAFITDLPVQWQEIDILVNNAGLALGRDLFDEADIHDWDVMLDTNVKGLLYVTRAILPLMKKKGSGHIINVGSTAAKEVYERGNVYCASKAAVDSLTKAMRIDLLKHRIKVTAIHPGAAETEFSLVRFKGSEDAAKMVYEGYEALKAEDVARIIFFAATLPPHVCINDLVVTPTQQANSYHFDKSGPINR